VGLPQIRPDLQVVLAAAAGVIDAAGRKLSFVLLSPSAVAGAVGPDGAAVCAATWVVVVGVRAITLSCAS
jgi:hypothetical protein